MRGYLEQFDKLAKDGATEGLGGPERAILHLLGLFDRPADGKAVEALLAQRIPGLTDDLFVEFVQTTTGRWFWKSIKTETRDLSTLKRAQRLRYAKERLRKLRLLSKANPHDPLELDAHPIVRAFFSSRLDETAPEAAKAAHEILYRHYSAQAPDLPDTLNEMAPLFSAVQHGVKAGRAQEAYDKVFRRRIRRGNEVYILRVLGATGPHLSATASFFDPPWRTPRRDLTPSSQAFLLNTAAFALTALGRLADSVEPLRASLQAVVAIGDLKNAANAADSLCQTLLRLGEVESAIDAGKSSAAYAQQSGSDDMLNFAYSDLAHAYAQAGHFDISEEYFVKSEQIGGGERHTRFRATK